MLCPAISCRVLRACLVLWLGSLSAWATKTHEARAEEIPHFSLIMNADADLCQPLTSLYDLLLSKTLTNDEHLVTRSRNSISIIPDYEVSKESAFRSIGLQPFAGTVRAADPAIIHADVFNDGQKISISIHDAEDAMGSVLTIIKNRSDLRLIGFSALLAGQVGQPSSEGYLLTKWPGLTQIKEFISSGKRLVERVDGKDYSFRPELPLFQGGVIQRPFIFKNDVIFIMNTPLTLSGRGEADGMVLAVRFFHNQHEDLCYLALSPSSYVNELAEEAKGSPNIASNPRETNHE